MSIDELRIVNILEKWAASYDKRWQRNPFGFDKVRATLCRKIAQAIREGKHQ